MPPFTRCAASTVATTALHTVLPVVRSSTLTPFAAAVCSSGTAPMISTGSVQ